jgi:uracil-DNA glycosylase
MVGPPVVGNPVRSPVMLVGQAPGSREAELGRPFAWTAGRTLFGWFRDIGVDEHVFRERVFMAAVCRCFPGKVVKGGDRVPSREEIESCSHWREAELRLLRPELIIPVGKLAAAQFLPISRLEEAVGRVFSRDLGGWSTDIVPLPHPSGASTWHRLEPGKGLLREALRQVAAHPAWERIRAG